MTSPIIMDSGALSDAAKLYESAHNSAQDAVKALAGTLDSHWGCAGTDSAGKTWADSYDPAAFRAVAAGTAIVNAFGKLHDLLAVTAVNHSNTEKANKQPPEAPDPNPALVPGSTAPMFKGAYGGDSDAPFGWGLITRFLQGHAWPNGHPDKLRALATAWRNAASAIGEASRGTNPAWVTLEKVNSGEIPQALAQMDLVFTQVDDLDTQWRHLADACDDWADKIEDAHHKILAILAGALGAGLLVGGVVGLLTAGTGTPLVEGGVGSAAGAAIVGILVTFDGAAALSAGATVAAGVAIGGVLGELQPLLAAGPTTFNSSTRPGGGDWNYHPPPKGKAGLPGFPNAKPLPKMGPRYRARWSDKDGNLYEWDYQHGAVEKYGKNGKHLGEFDPNTGTQTKPPDPGRKPER